jgi:hypothetical protein
MPRPVPLESMPRVRGKFALHTRPLWAKVRNLHSRVTFVCRMAPTMKLTEARKIREYG